MTADGSEGAARRVAHVAAALALGLAFVGFLRGVRDTGLHVSAPRPAPAVSYAPAPGYAELRQVQRGPNARLYDAAFPALSRDLPSAHDEVRQTKEDREAAVGARARRRAYDGAPPTIPHAVDQQRQPPCLACHGSGAKVAGKVATRMSHARHDNCLQCHVVDSDPRPAAPRVAAPDNGFVGLASPTRGARAYDGAPPTIPHSTLMREQCGSCHGVAGLHGMRSTHAHRQSCTQCHAPSATLDQREITGAAGPAGWSPVP